MDEPAVAANHGAGVSVEVIADPLLADRDFSAEEVSAMTWKCRMEKSPPEVIAQLLKRLPEECIMRLVEEYRGRTTAGATTSEGKGKRAMLHLDARCILCTIKSDAAVSGVERIRDW